MDNKDKVVNLLTKIAVGILMLWAAYITNTVANIQAMDYGHSARLLVIESSRFSTSDGYELEHRLEEQISISVGEIKDCLNRIQQDRQCD